MERKDYQQRLEIIRTIIQMNNGERGTTMQPNVEAMLTQEYAAKADELNIPTAVLHKILLDAKSSKMRLCTRSIEEAWSYYCEHQSAEEKVTFEQLYREKVNSLRCWLEGALLDDMQKFCYEHNNPQIYWNAYTEWKNGKKKGFFWSQLRDWMNGNGYHRNEELDRLAREFRQVFGDGNYIPQRLQDMTYEEYKKKTGDNRIEQLAKVYPALSTVVNN